MSVRSFTSSLCKTIIERVQERPEIWKTSHPMYKKRYLHQQFWEQMAKELGVNDKVLKKRWKHLKDQYRKELKRAQEKDDEDAICWQFYRPLSFLRNEVQRKNKERQTTNLQPTTNDSAESSDEEQDMKPEVFLKPEIQQKVRIITKITDDSTKLNVILKRLTNTKNLLEKKLKETKARNEDPDYMYLVSLLPTIKQLTDVEKLQFRGKINSWLLEALSNNSSGNTEQAGDEYDSDNFAPVMEIIKYESP